MDLFATLIDLAGAHLPSGLELDGVSLAPLLLDNQALPERNLYWQFKSQKAVRKGDWKLVVFTNRKQGDNVYLFNLKDDLSETDNLAGQYPDIVEALTEALEKWETGVSAGVEKRT